MDKQRSESNDFRSTGYWYHIVIKKIRANTLKFLFFLLLFGRAHLCGAKCKILHPLNPPPAGEIGAIKAMRIARMPMGIKSLWADSPPLAGVGGWIRKAL